EPADEIAIFVGPEVRQGTVGERHLAVDLHERVDVEASASEVELYRVRDSGVNGQQLADRFRECARLDHDEVGNRSLPKKVAGLRARVPGDPQGDVPAAVVDGDGDPF